MDHFVCLHIVDANPLSRNSLIQIASQLHWRHQLYESAEAFLARYRPQELECLLISLDQPGMSGLQLIQEVRRRYWSVTIVATHPWPSTAVVVDAMQAGACDFLEQPFDSASLNEKVTRATTGDEQTKRRLRERTTRLTTLSAREREVLDLLLAAATTVCIANRLQISPKTVEKHRTNVMTKLNVGSVPELMKLWLQCTPGALPELPAATRQYVVPMSHLGQMFSSPATIGTT
ncbi:Transcriptional regulatory protein FixJ [Anatilimnocola aggregata]|uniref:Transcriptional regulatory protein FixJ n=1 Tax=Anatilimnocola aggregata TaxID=2528021 RepID=A0A517YM86_9BACT|nr:LuxR C-terminal-related transcriptional regulator [Anatilimnocola aggregata]QDU31321.1 Transcriptional regulatory protein FixJ [Anatilimnocola aggregata]